MEKFVLKPPVSTSLTINFVDGSVKIFDNIDDVKEEGGWLYFTVPNPKLRSITVYNYNRDKIISYTETFIENHKEKNQKSL